MGRIDDELVGALAGELNILPLTARLLVNRGIIEAGAAFGFLTPSLKDLHDPFLFKDMEKAAQRVCQAVTGREKIAIYGDYDVDGATSAAMLYLFFKEIGVDVLCYIPDRALEGYGVNAKALDYLKAAGASLVITVDCGSSDYEAIGHGRAAGLDVIVTDHHEMPPAPPPALAILNPKQEGCGFPFKGLAGVGVAFNLLMAARARLRLKGWFKGEAPLLRKFLDLVAIGTVADMVPLKDENRIFVSYGLKEINGAPRPGLLALMEAARIKSGETTAETIGFQIAPRLNAAGRLKQAKAAFDLLVTDDSTVAAMLAVELNAENARRQRLEEEILNEALGMIAVDAPERGIVLSSSAWHPGVIGIVASRLVERFGKPAVMIAVDNGAGKGSARGTRAFNMLEGLRSCSALLDRFGGHKAAAGLTVSGDKIERFAQEFVAYCNGALSDDDLVPDLHLDAEVQALADIDMRVVGELASLAPFGQANKEPLLVMSNARIVQTEVFGFGGKHLRLKLDHNGSIGDGVGFGLAGLRLVKGEGFSVAFSPFIDSWQGVKRIKLRVKDVQVRTVGGRLEDG
ncbi:MAG: single-stranded-DNA-specific exonuclease RecJ [Deltaproteobacteria bacterium]|nr:single-stranded-DNA-specific exonuclease RecJ [Deltaproteobacteria bacterium]